MTTVLHFSNAGGDFNAGGEFQRQRISTPNSGFEDPLGRGQPGDGTDRAMARGAPLELPSLDLGFLEAALAADLITAGRTAAAHKVERS